MERGVFAIMITMALFWNAAALAGGTLYQMRVDGMARPHRVYAIEKMLKKIEGVEHVEIDLNKGLVTVKVAEGVKLTEAQMKKLCKDAGFTYRSMKEKPL